MSKINPRDLMASYPGPVRTNATETIIVLPNPFAQMEQDKLVAALPDPVLRRLMQKAANEVLFTTVHPAGVIRFSKGPLGTKVQLAYSWHKFKKALFSIGTELRSDDK